MPEIVTIEYDKMVFDELKNGEVLHDYHIERMENGILQIEKIKRLTIDDIDDICKDE